MYLPPQFLQTMLAMPPGVDVVRMQVSNEPFALVLVVEGDELNEVPSENESPMIWLTTFATTDEHDTPIVRYEIPWSEVMKEAEPETSLHVCLLKTATREPCSGPADYEVLFWSSSRERILDRKRCCFQHGLSTVERHTAAGGISQAELVEAGS